MAMTHEFGIMATDPLPGERYDCMSLGNTMLSLFMMTSSSR